jgi:pyruvate formate lyase activating enzyme
VLQTCERAKGLGIHVEVTYLVIPQRNDSLDEIQGFCEWVVKDLGVETPVHFSRFHPDYQMTDVPATSIETLLRVYKLAKEVGIRYPYLGNVSHGEYENTFCPACGSLLIERFGFSVAMKGLEGNRCKQCDAEVPILTS